MYQESFYFFFKAHNVFYAGRVAGGGSVFKKIFFGSLRPQFGLEIRGRGRAPWPLPGLGTESWQGRLNGLLLTMLKPFYCRVSITTIAMLAYANGRISQPFWQSSEVFFLNLTQ